MEVNGKRSERMGVEAEEGWVPAFSGTKLKADAIAGTSTRGGHSYTILTAKTCFQQFAMC